MTTKLSGHERLVVAAFAGLSVAAGAALLDDMQIVSLSADKTLVTDVVNLVRRLLLG
jgi:hypothetical protein